MEELNAKEILYALVRNVYESTITKNMLVNEANVPNMLMVALIVKESLQDSEVTWEDFLYLITNNYSTIVPDTLVCN